MIELIYISRAASRFDQLQLTNLLMVSRKHNQQLDITGLLLYDGFGTFIQVLEGPEEPVDRLFNKIKTDVRHSNINKLGCRHINQRGFPDWRMGFKLFSQENIPGFSDFLNNSESTNNLDAQHNFAMKMLNHFRDSQ